MSIGEGSGSGAGTEFVTMRGRDYPSIRQFTVFLENRVGQLMDVVRRFEGSQVRIVAPHDFRFDRVRPGTFPAQRSGTRTGNSRASRAWRSLNPT